MPCLSHLYSTPESHTMASGTGLLASSTTVMFWPAVPVATSGFNRPLRINARLDLPLPMKSMT